MLSAVNEGDVNLQTLVMLCCISDVRPRHLISFVSLHLQRPRSACVRMKGVATSIDLQSVSFEIQMISSALDFDSASIAWLPP